LLPTPNSEEPGIPCPSERGDFDDPPDPDVEPSEVVKLGLRLLGGL